MTTPPLVSVVIPCFNAGRMLTPTLRSVLAQTHPNIEIIFVDNNSTDDSVAVARTIAAASPHPFHILHCPHQGCNYPRNMGYTRVRGDYVQWLDADDALGVQKIELQVAALERDPAASIAYCDWMSSRHEPNGGRRDSVALLAQVDDQILRTLSGIWYPPHSYLIRRAAADALQAEQAWFPERRVGTDIEYSAVAALLGMRFVHVPSARVQYNTWTPAQISGAATRYEFRVAMLRAIYARLRDLSERPDIAPRVTERHRILLEQDWNVWAMPKGSVEIRELSPRLFRLSHVASGRTVEVAPREAAVARAMMGLRKPGVFAHHALQMAARAPALKNDQPFIIATLERFRRDGLLLRLEPADMMRAAGQMEIAPEKLAAVP